MAKNDLPEITKPELTSEQLDEVTGGVITSAQAGLLNPVLKNAKASGKTMDEVIALIPGYYQQMHMIYPNVTIDDVEKYVREVWDSL